MNNCSPEFWAIAGAATALAAVGVVAIVNSDEGSKQTQTIRQANAVLQVFDLSSSSAFADAAGTPPQAAYVSVVGRFLVLSGLLSTPYRIQWSGLNSFNASTSWNREQVSTGSPEHSKR